jgi:hypothetical protein
MAGKRGRPMRKTPQCATKEGIMRTHPELILHEVEKVHKGDYPEKTLKRITAKIALTNKKMSIGQMINFESVGRSRLQALNNMYQLISANATKIRAPTKAEFERARAKKERNLGEEIIVNFVEISKGRKIPVGKNPRDIWINAILKFRSIEMQKEIDLLTHKIHQ